MFAPRVDKPKIQRSTGKPMPRRPGQQQAVQSQYNRAVLEKLLMPRQPQQRPPHLPVGAQAKLKVGAVNDPLEHEADRVADAVLRMPAGGIAVGSAPPQISRKCAACEDEVLRAKPIAAGEVSEAPASVDAVLKSDGEPLEAGARAFFEPRFGSDFSAVRVHTGDAAQRAARAVNASAFTVGNDIVFGAGAYALQKRTGQQLLAHELTHVVQQRGGSAPVQVQRKALTSSERDAAVAFNQALIDRVYTIGVLRVTVGLSPNPAKLDATFADALAKWQEDKRLTGNGKLEPATIEGLVLALIDPHPRDAIILTMDAFALHTLAGIGKNDKLDFLKVSSKDDEENCCFERGKPRGRNPSDAVTHGGKFDPNDKNRGGNAEICFCLFKMRPKARSNFPVFVRIIGHELVHIPQHTQGFGAKHVMDQALYEFKAYFWEVCGGGRAQQYPPRDRKHYAGSALRNYEDIDLSALPKAERDQVAAERLLLLKLMSLDDAKLKPVPCDQL